MGKAWQDRPREEAYAFNPAFFSSLLCDFVREFTKAKHVACPITLAVLAPSVSLHRQTRARLPSRTVTSMYEWLQNNEDVLVDLRRRNHALLPMLREGLKFGVYQKVIDFSDGHLLVAGPQKGHFTDAFLDTVSSDMRDAIVATRFLAKWFAKSGSEASVLSGWGVRP